MARTKGHLVEFTQEIAVKELKHVPWTALSFALKIDQSIETQIAEGSRDESDAMGQLIRHWLDNDESASWEILAKTVMGFPPFKRNGAYLYNKYVNPECFTAEKIVDELHFIQDWFQLAHPFLDNSERIKEAVKDTFGVAEKRMKVIEFWLSKYYDVPSWEEVARIVEECFPEYDSKAEEIRQKYLPEVNIFEEDEMMELEDLSNQSAFTETCSVTDWYALGYFLGLPESELIRIENEYSRSDSRRQAVLDEWLVVQGDNASWLSLAKAIAKMRSNKGLSIKLLNRLPKQEMKKRDIIESRSETGSVDVQNTTVATSAAIIESLLCGKANDSKYNSDNSGQVESIKDDIGAIQATVYRFADVKHSQAVNSALDRVKSQLESLNTFPDQTTPGLEHEPKHKEKNPSLAGKKRKYTYDKGTSTDQEPVFHSTTNESGDEPIAKRRAIRLYEAFEACKNKSAEWDAIGRECKVSYDIRQELLRDCLLKNHQRLEHVLNIWIESSPDVRRTNFDLIDILNKLGFCETARRVNKN